PLRGVKKPANPARSQGCRNRSEFLRGSAARARPRQVRPRGRAIASLSSEQAAGNVHPSSEFLETVRNLILMSPHRPSFEDFSRWVGKSPCVPVYRQLTGDSLTPVLAFGRI